jgi:hypothetical protein
MADQKRRTEGQWINGKWVTTSIGAAEGSGDTSATSKEKFQNVSGLAALARKMKDQREQKAGTAVGTPPPRPSPSPVPVSSADPEDETEVARRLAGRALSKRYGSLALGRLMGRG